MSGTLILLAMLITAQTGTDTGTSPGLIVVTTDRIAARSAMLEPFIREKEAFGFTVELLTEADYGSPEARGEARARAIRTHLAAIAADHRYVLLIGDPDPDLGDVPMWRVWPRHTYPPTECGGFAVDCRSALTDHLYANLSGDWDLSDNGRYGETGDDEGPGGIDFTADLLAGRIPVYFDDVRELDAILSHAMAFMNATVDQAAYRSRVLLPASFFYFRGERMTTYTVTAHIDGADITEWFARHHLEPAGGFEITRLYETAGAAVTAHEADQLTRERVVSEWRRGQGMVFWAGHGSEYRVSRTIWPEDTDGDGIAENDEIRSLDLLTAADAPALGTGAPAFVMGVSCEIGSAQAPGNLSWALLRYGAAVGVVGSSSVTPAARMDWSDQEAPLPEDALGGDNMGIAFFASLMEGIPAGEAFYDAKLRLGVEGSPEPMAAKMMLNYFGDPSLTLTVTVEDRLEPMEDPDITSTGGGGCSSAPQPASPLMAALLFLLAGILLRRRRA